MNRERLTLVGVVAAMLVCVRAYPASPPEGYRDIAWGSTLEEVQGGRQGPPFARVPDDNAFPEGIDVARYLAQETIAGYPAEVTYYFHDGIFFQVTIRFPFRHLQTYDYNYNVFRSVDEFYRVIHDQTVTFVHDIFALLQKKYGRKEPVFKGLDPRAMFVTTNRYLRQERWNLRYNPREYYKRIVGAAYARWDFPRTRVIFAINISASDKRFDYTLSLTSLEHAAGVQEAIDALRMQGL